MFCKLLSIQGPCENCLYFPNNDQPPHKSKHSMPCTSTMCPLLVWMGTYVTHWRCGVLVIWNAFQCHMLAVTCASVWRKHCVHFHCAIAQAARPKFKIHPSQVTLTVLLIIHPRTWWVWLTYPLCKLNFGWLPEPVSLSAWYIQEAFQTFCSAKAKGFHTQSNRQC